MAIRDNLKPALERAAEQIEALLNEEEEHVGDAIQEAYLQHESESEFTFRVGAGIKLTPRGDSIKVQAELNWSVRHVVRAEPAEASNHPELDLES